MIWAVILAVLLFGLCGIVHFFMIQRVRQFVAVRTLGHGGRMLIGFYAAGLTHLFEAGLYAIGFWLGRTLGLGDFKSAEGPIGAMETYYFSLVNYTSLGLGDIYPTGHLRFLAGVESLNGFLLISCSAAMIFVLMSDRHD